MIQIQDLKFKYVGRKAQALAGIDLHIREGETVLLLGPSGSGKSTLALCLNGLIPQIVGGRMEGQVRVAGLDSGEAPVSDLAQQVGILFQDPEAQFVTMTVEDEIAFGLENLRVPPEEMDGRIRDALDQVGIGHYRRQRVDALSGGEKQRLALAALLAMRPQILIFDEPTANLDPVGTQQVFETIARLKRAGQHTIVIIEHKLDDLMHLVDRVVALTHEGTILADGAPHVVFDTQADVLLEHGVWMPRATLLAHSLRACGVDLTPFPITLHQAEQALFDMRALLGSHGHRPAARAHNHRPPAVDVRDLSFSYGRTRRAFHKFLG
jgi:energy-coupling factor transport system ATP-binding protein